MLVALPHSPRLFVGQRSLTTRLQLLLLLLLPLLLDLTSANIPSLRADRRRRAFSPATVPRTARDAPYEFRVIERAKHGSLIGEPLSRSIGKQSANMRFQFSQMNRYLGINSTSGQIWVKSVIDREALCSYVRTCCPTLSNTEQCYIPVRVVVNINKLPMRIINVQVHVDDINDEPPRFPTSTRMVSLAENTPIGTAVQVTAANDRDTYQNAVKSYKLTRCDENVFNLTYSRTPGSRKGHEVQLILNKNLDHETQIYYTCRIEASDGKHEEAMDVKLTVKDVNDHAPEWSRNDFKVTLREDFPRYSQFFQLKATDKDEDFGEVTYSFGTHSSQLHGPFSLNRETGAISLEEELNYDANGQTIYKLPVVASDNGRPVPLSVTNTVTVIVQDVNDNAPVIKVHNTRLNIEENKAPTFLTLITVTDKDQGLNGQVSCSLETYNHMFNLTRMDEGAYSVHFTVPIDREQAQIPSSGILKVVVMCTDAGKSPKSSREDIMVYVTDVNDHAPRFSKPNYEARLAEDQPGGTIFLTVHATDADHGDNAKLEYSLIADPQLAKYLTVEGHSGAVASADRFDREVRDRYEFQILVKDRGTPSLNDTTKVTLIITDINDNSPKFPAKDQHRFQIKESAPQGTILGIINATDPDLGENGSVIFGQERGQANLPFVVRQNGQIELTRSLDREQVADYSLTVTARDRGPDPKMSSTTLIINVLDVNDSPPRFDPKTISLINISCDEAENNHFHPPAFITATDPDENSRVHYSLAKQQNPWHLFTIDKITGQLTVKTRPTKCRSTRFYLMVIATDADKPHFTKSKRIRVVVHGPTNKNRGTYRDRNYGGNSDDRSPPYDLNNIDGDGSADDLDLNLIIIIILVCTAIVLTFVMLAAALYLRKRQLRSAQEYEKGRREMPDGDTMRRDRDRHMGPPGSMYTASLPSSPRKEFEHVKKSNMSLEDVYHEHEMDTKMYTMPQTDGSVVQWFARRNTDPEASRLKLEGSSSKLKPAQYGNDSDESGVPLNPQISHESTHTYQSMSTHKESPENAGYTVFQHELFSYIPDTLRSANVDSKKKNKTSQVTISFV